MLPTLPAVAARVPSAIGAGYCYQLTGFGEDSDYEGHSLSMLSRIAEALQKKLSVVMTAKDPEVGTLR